MVGYKKPPVERRFKPGQSGNPKGRPKSKKFEGMPHLVSKLLNETIVVNKGGKHHKVPVVEALTLKMIQAASEGNWKAFDSLLKIYGSYTPPRVEPIEFETLEEAAAAYDAMIREL